MEKVKMPKLCGECGKREIVYVPAKVQCAPWEKYPNIKVETEYDVVELLTCQNCGNVGYLPGDAEKVDAARAQLTEYSLAAANDVAVCNADRINSIIQREARYINPSVEGGLLIYYNNDEFGAYIECYNDGEIGYTLTHNNKSVSSRDLVDEKMDALDFIRDIQVHLGQSTSDRTDRRINMFVERGYYPTKKAVIDAAVDLLMREQKKRDSEIAGQEFKEDEIILTAQGELMR